MDMFYPLIRSMLNLVHVCYIAYMTLIDNHPVGAQVDGGLELSALRKPAHYDRL